MSTIRQALEELVSASEFAGIPSAWERRLVGKALEAARTALAEQPETQGEVSDAEIVALWEQLAPFKARDIFAPLAFARAILALRTKEAT